MIRFFFNVKSPLFIGFMQASNWLSHINFVFFNLPIITSFQELLLFILSDILHRWVCHLRTKVVLFLFSQVCILFLSLPHLIALANGVESNDFGPDLSRKALSVKLAVFFCSSCLSSWRSSPLFLFAQSSSLWMLDFVKLFFYILIWSCDFFP